MVTKRKGKGDKEREREKRQGLVDEQGDEEQDCRENRVTLVVDRLSAHLYELLLPVYVLFTLLTVPRLSIYRQPNELPELFEIL